MTFTLPPLPYDMRALEPHISEKTLQFHYGKHHQGYVTKLNELIAGTDFEKEALEIIIERTANSTDKKAKAIFNNAAQVWNHSFYWHCMKSNGGGIPKGKLAEEINSRFGNIQHCVDQLKEKALAQFGSGWGWLVVQNGVLEIVSTANAELPFIKDMIPLLTVDVWEHAYYLDYQNARAQYLTVFFEHLVNWEFAERLFEHKRVFRI